MDISNWLFAAAVASNITNRNVQRALVEGVVVAELDALGNTPREEWVPEGEILRREEELEGAFRATQ